LQVKSKFIVNEKPNEPIGNLNTRDLLGYEGTNARQNNQYFAKTPIFPQNNSDNNFYKAARLIDEVADPPGFSAGNSWNAVKYFSLALLIKN
jgi:hypothetical protein